VNLLGGLLLLLLLGPFSLEFKGTFVLIDFIIDLASDAAAPRFARILGDELTTISEFDGNLEGEFVILQ